MQKVDLATALELAQHGLTDDAIALGTDKGLDGKAALRCSGNDTQVAQTFERHAESARNRCRSEGQYIHLRAQRLHGLFVAHAKAVLLVDDEQSQILEFGALAQQLVRANHNIHGAVGQPLECDIDLLCRAKAAHLNDFHRPLGKTIDQRLVVLLGEQRGWCQQRHLLAAGDTNEGGAQRDLGLAKAHITANQPVHRARADHVLNHGMNGGILVRRFIKGEIPGKSFVVGRRVTEGVTLAGSPASVDIEQLGGAVAHLFGGLAPRLFPLT